MGLKVYGLAITTGTARVRTCLAEKEVEYELVPVQLSAGEQKHPTFLSKNPFAMVPVLEDGNFTLFESRAITSYVCNKYKEQGTDLLRHKNLKEAATVQQWIEVESQQYQPAIQPIFYQMFVGPMRGEGPPDKAVIKAHAAQLSSVLDVYEARLSATKYLAGDFYSLADLHHLAFTFYIMKTEHAKLINERPHVRAWWEDISSRPAFLKVTENMKRDIYY